MIIDAHTHIFPDEVRRNRRSFSHRDERFRIIYANEKARMAGPEDLLQAMDREGIGQSVICGFPWNDPGLCRENNDFLWECARENPGRMIPFACLPLKSGRAAIRELERCVARGFRGIGEIAFYGRDITRREMACLSAALQLLGQRGIPLLLHTNEPVGHVYPGKSTEGLQSVYRIVSAVPGAPIILAHWGGGFFFYELMPEVARAARNVFYDTAASPFLYDPRIYSMAVKIVGPDRILFGSDFPLIPPSRYFAEMDRIRLSRPVRDKIKGQNARRLLLRYETEEELRDERE